MVKETDFSASLLSLIYFEKCFCGDQNQNWDSWSQAKDSQGILLSLTMAILNGLQLAQGKLFLLLPLHLSFLASISTKNELLLQLKEDRNDISYMKR